MSPDKLDLTLHLVRASMAVSRAFPTSTLVNWLSHCPSKTARRSLAATAKLNGLRMTLLPAERQIASPVDNGITVAEFPL